MWRKSNMLHLICYFWTLRIETFNRLTRTRALSNELLNYHSDVERAKKKGRGEEIIY